MKQEKQQEIALMRYGAIAPIIAGLDERYPSSPIFFLTTVFLLIHDCGSGRTGSASGIPR